MENIEIFICELRKKGLTYKKIQEELRNQDIEMGIHKILSVIEKYENNNEIVFDEKSIKKIDETIVKYKDLRKTYNDIVKALNELDIKVTYTFISIRCKEIFSSSQNLLEIRNELEKQEDDRFDKEENKKINETIVKARDSKIAYYEIVNSLKKEGYDVDYSFIKKRTDRIYEDKEGLEKIRNELEDTTLQDKIFKLREKRMTYAQIVEELNKQGYNVTYYIVSKECKKAYENRNLNNSRKISSIPTEKNKEIFKLRKQGKTFREIADMYNISYQAIEQICNKMIKFEKVDKRVISRQEINDKKFFEYDDFIYDLRKQKKSLGEIKEELEKKGIKVGIDRISKRLKIIFEEKGEKFVKFYKRPLSDTDKRIYDLKKEGYTYSKILEILQNEGIKISMQTVMRKYKRVSKENGDEIPKKLEGKEKEEFDKKWENRIFELRRQNKSYKEITEIVNSEGYDYSVAKVVSVCKKVFKEKDIEEPTFKDLYPLSQMDQRVFDLRSSGKQYKEIIEIIEEEYGKKMTRTMAAYITNKVNNRRKELVSGLLKLVETRKATMEQLEIMADYYGVELPQNKDCLEGDEKE